MSSPRDVLRAIRDELQQVFLERNELIDGALVALVAAQHVLVIGPPGTPKSMLPYLQDGSSSASILWNVENLGYLTAWAGVQLAAGKDFQATNKVNAPRPACGRGAAGRGRHEMDGNGSKKPGE